MSTAIESTTTTTAAQNATTETATGGAGGTTSAATTTASSQTAADWTSGLPEDLRGYVQNKGFKDPGAVADSYRNLEKLIGGGPESIIKLPKNGDPEATRAVLQKLGLPEKADGYALPQPKEGQGSPEFIKWAQGVFHEAGLTQKQAEAVVSKWNELQGNTTKAALEAETAKNQQEAEALKKEWGAAYNDNAAMVDQAAETFGMNEQQLLKLKEVMGPAAAMKFLHNIGSKLGEAKFVGAESGGQGFNKALSPAAAKDRIQALTADPAFSKRYIEGDVEARAEMERLHKFAFGQSA
jgi:hypothetical protein